MSYTFTERKRIRKSFGTRDSVPEIPLSAAKCSATPIPPLQA